MASLTYAYFENAWGPMIRILEGHTNSVDSVAITADGKRAVSGSKDHTVKVWDLTGTLISTFHTDSEVLSCATDDKRIVVGDSSGRVHVLVLEE